MMSKKLYTLTQTRVSQIVTLIAKILCANK